MPSAARLRMLLAAMAGSACLVACGGIHGRADAGADAGAEPDSGLPDDDAGVDAGTDAGVDAGPSTINLSVTVYADRLDHEPVEGVRWIVAGRSSRMEGVTLADGRVVVAVEASDAPYAWTGVLPGGMGARSITGVDRSLNATVHIEPRLPGRTADRELVEVAAHVVGLGGDEHVALTGTGVDGLLSEVDTFDFSLDQAALAIELLVVSFEPFVPDPAQLGLGTPRRGLVAFRASSPSSMPETLEIDLTEATEPERVELVLTFPSEGFFRPSMGEISVDAVRRAEDGSIDAWLPVGPVLRQEGDQVIGTLAVFPEGPLRAESVWLTLDEGGGQGVDLFFHPLAGEVVIPAVRASPRITGDRAAEARYEFQTDGWQGSRYGVAQTLADGLRIGWVCVDASGALDAALPLLPEGVDLRALGFDVSAPADAFIVPVHRLDGLVTEYPFDGSVADVRAAFV